MMLAVLAMPWLAPARANQCEIEQFPAVAVTLKDMQPLVWARINGKPARFIIDTGAFWSMISPAARAQYHLFATDAMPFVRLGGVNGSTAVEIASVSTFEFLGVPFRDAKFFVGGNAFASGAVGLLGGKLLHLWDLDLDFARGRMRFVKTRHCGGVPLAYWAQGRQQNIGVVKLRYSSARDPYLIGHAWVNGKRIRVLFDTGAARSVLTVAAARRAGITLASPGVKWLGKVSSGIGRKWLNTWIAPVATFRIGDEVIEHTHITVSAIHMPGLHVGMLLGEDFFLSNHVLIAAHRRRLYFTYNGGPIFAIGQRYLIQRGAAAPVAVDPGGQPPAHAPATSPPGTRRMRVAAGSASERAARRMRRAMALEADGQYTRALANMNRSCRLAPKDARYRMRRGYLYERLHRPAAALANFSAAIRLQPDFYAAHLARAQLLLTWKHAPAGSVAEARTDLNIVALLAPNESEDGLAVGNLYARIGEYATAVRILKLWLYYHRRDILRPFAWDGLCAARAAGDMQLHRALRDCERALARRPHSAPILEHRGLVYLRLGKFARAIASYDAALALAPKLAPSLYGRGLAELAAHETAAGRADLTAAVKLDPGVASRFARMHLAP
jgi:tetratricopeptide (TPR) repeat protein